MHLRQNARRQRLSKPDRQPGEGLPAAAAVAGEIVECVEVVPEADRLPAFDALQAEPAAQAAGSELSPVASHDGPTARAMEDRVRQFMESQSAPPAEPAAPIVPPPPQRVWTDVLAGFMEEKNIRWGELVGGLLIVCCSIALVISFWAKIAERPFLKFFVFGGVTAALFAVGFYTERRWKLRTTSRGLLVIATLLVPLNFLAIAAFDQEASRQVAFIAGELISVALFAALVWAAGRILVPLGAVALAIGVMVPAVLQLIERRLVGPAATWPLLYGLGAIPLVCYGGANGWLVAGRSRQPALDEAEAHSLFRLLGLTTFSILLPLGLWPPRQGTLSRHCIGFAALVCAGLGASGHWVAGRSSLASGSAVELARGRHQHRDCRRCDLAGRIAAGLARPGRTMPAVIAEIILFEAIRTSATCRRPTLWLWPAGRWDT